MTCNRFQFKTNEPSTVRTLYNLCLPTVRFSSIVLCFVKISSCLAQFFLFSRLKQNPLQNFITWFEHLLFKMRTNLTSPSLIHKSIYFLRLWVEILFILIWELMTCEGFQSITHKPYWVSIPYWIWTLSMRCSLRVPNLFRLSYFGLELNNSKFEQLGPVTKFNL